MTLSIRKCPMENNHAPGAGYSALLPPVILFAAATSSVWVFQIND
jgi:hypothetical protein